MSPFLQFVQEMLPALSQMLAVYGFGIAFFLFISQTETYNRVAWFAKKADDHHVWVAIFNTSRRCLVKDQIYREHLSIAATVAADAAGAAGAADATGGGTPPPGSGSAPTGGSPNGSQRCA